ncbi:MAG: thiamine phosphate synthase [Alphaproteobacteria bacterium]|nr:MAG: thiamine phosphate synthase [Alphaproteobacteria bacterium]
MSELEEVSPPPRLLLITPPQIDLAVFAAALPEVLDAGDVACVQLRFPDLPVEARIAAIRHLVPLIQAQDIAVTIANDVALAVQVGADGVHLEAPSLKAVRAARKALPDGIVGISAGGSRHLALELAEEGVDYVSFGPCFASATVDTPPLESLEPLLWWAEIMTVPAVAVGGITAERATDIASTGVEFLAVCSFVWSHPDGPATAVAALTAAVAS